MPDLRFVLQEVVLEGRADWFSVLVALPQGSSGPAAPKRFRSSERVSEDYSN